MAKDIIPADVTNVKEYKKYLALLKHPAIQNSIYIASNGDEINVGMLPHMLKKKIAGLSPKEQEYILELKRKYHAITGKIASAKRMAFKRQTDSGLPDVNLLTPFEDDIIELLGKMFTIHEVVKIMGEDNGIIISEADVKEVLRKNIAEVERRREDFKDRVSDVRLYNKRPRLEELAWMYGRMKLRYVAVNSTEAYNAMLRTLEQIRKEAEGDIINIRGAIDVNVEAKIQQHIQTEILKTINLREIILGRVAARMNYDVAKLVAGLHNSYYAKFVDISESFDENAEMRYPSSSPYDFDEIARTAEENTIDITAEEVNEDEAKEATDLKEMFLAKIRNKKKQIQARKTNIEILTRDKVNEANVEGGETIKKRGYTSRSDSMLKSTRKTETRKKTKRDYYSGKKEEP